MLLVDNVREDSVPGNQAGDSVEVDVLDVRNGAEDVKIYDLSRRTGDALPDATPGSHIDVHLENGVLRQYSLLAAERRPKTYSIAVKRDEHSRGGSRYMHEQVGVGTCLKISAPRNTFPLFEDAPHTVFIAGGIGLTPIWCMLNRLHQLGRSWQLFYCCRSASQALFAKELEAYHEVRTHFDDCENGRLLDIGRIIAEAPPHSHLYCCGPSPLMKVFTALTATSWDPHQLHTEYFSPREEAAHDRSFTVKLARSGAQILVQRGQSILKALQEAGHNVAYSCEEGICGTCETRVIAGLPDHRDSVLTAAERTANTKMMICCSGSFTDELELDL